MFNWSPDAVRFMADACRRTDFHEKLTAMLLPYLGGAAHVCDAGCGLGYLSLTLAPHFKCVTAAERDNRALDVLCGELSARRVRNVIPLCTDVLTYTPSEKFDAMVFCFFGSMEEILDTARRQCSGSVAAVVRDDTCHRFSGAPRRPGRHSFGRACAVLEEHGVPYTAQRAALEFPQPFRTLDDARAFLALYGGGESAEAALRTQLVSTGDTDFPWLLPGVRRFGILAFSMKEGENT